MLLVASQSNGLLELVTIFASTVAKLKNISSINESHNYLHRPAHWKP